MSFKMFGSINTYENWARDIIDLAMKFKKEFNFFPNYIFTNDKTLSKMFDSCESKPSFTDSEGNELLQVQVDSEGFLLQKGEEIKEPQEDQEEEYLLENYKVPMPDSAFDDDKIEVCYPKTFGVNEDCTVSFLTNKFEVYFLEGNNLPTDYFILQLGDGPDGDGEDFEDETENEMPMEMKFSA